MYIYWIDEKNCCLNISCITQYSIASFRIHAILMPVWATTVINAT